MCVFGEAEVEAACVVGAQVLAKGGCSGAAEEETDVRAQCLEGKS